MIAPEGLQDLVQKHLRDGKNQYVPMAGVPKLREQLAQKVNHAYGSQVNPDTDITITAGATQALFTAIATFIRPGDEVILIEPAYDSYGPSIAVAGGKVVAYELSAPDYKIDWQAFGQLVSQEN